MLEYVASLQVYSFGGLKNKKEVTLLPDGHVEMVFQFGKFSQKPIGTEAWKNRPYAFVGGLHNKGFKIRTNEDGGRLIGLRFKPEGARHFIPDKVNSLKNQVVSIDSIYGSSAKNLVEQMAETTVLGGIPILVNFLQNQFSEKSPSPIAKSVDALYKTKGAIKIETLAFNAAMSISHFRKKFTEEIGISPKEYSRIIRINLIADYLSENPHLSLTKVAYDFGYFDQSHFIKDVKQMYGSSPKKFIP